MEISVVLLMAQLWPGEGVLLVMGWNRVLELMVYEISEQFIKTTIDLGVKVFSRLFQDCLYNRSTVLVVMGIWLKSKD